MEYMKALLKTTPNHAEIQNVPIARMWTWKSSGSCTIRMIKTGIISRVG
jgi:hypothetical protein